MLGNQGYANSVGGQTHDVDLQQAQIANQQLEQAAQALASQYQMNTEKARQLAQLASRVSQLTQNGNSMTADDRESIANAALGVAHITAEEITDTLGKVARDGNQKAIDDLMVKAATNLGMPDATGLRDSLLPSLGISL